MFKSLLQDRPFIEGKYHKTNEEYNPLRRFKYTGWEPQNGTGLTNEEIGAELENLFQQDAALPHPISKARAFRFVTENSLIDINEHDYFVYFHAWGRLLNRYQLRWKKESEERVPEVMAKMKLLNTSGATSIWVDYDHVIPNWDDLLTLGFRGILERTEKYKEMHREKGDLSAEMSAVFDGIIMSFQAVLGLLDRYIAYGKQNPNEKTAAVVACLESLRAGAPTTLFEALQAMYIYFILCECVDNYQTRSFGNGFDQSLYRFYKSDLESGRYTKDELREYIGYFYLQFSAIDNYWGHPMYFGGTDKDGRTLYNEFSLFCLDLYDELEIHNPKIQLKINLNTPDEILNKALSMVRAKNASIVFCCEPGIVRALEAYGVPHEEAVRFEVSGCYETRVKYNESSSTSGYVNILKAVRYVLTDGFDETIQEQVGVHSGDLSNLKTFADFHEAFLRQFRYLIESSMEITNSLERDMAFVNPSNLYSGTVETALNKGEDAYYTGADYTNCSMLCCGFASAMDSLMAVKEFVYDKGAISLDELAKAIGRNWEGYEELRQQIKHSRLKYGNGIPEVDQYAESVAQWFTSVVNNRENARGGVYKALMHSAMQFVWQGEKTGATPDGRMNGEEISKNASPSIGMDREGVTALIKSVTELHPEKFLEGFCLDVMLHPTSVQGEDGLAVMKTLVMAYLKRNGMAIQFNVFSADTLRDAQKHPEKYRNLQVRVCGWNVLWNWIPKPQQDAYIRRAEGLEG